MRFTQSAIDARCHFGRYRDSIKRWSPAKLFVNPFHFFKILIRSFSVCICDLTLWRWWQLIHTVWSRCKTSWGMSLPFYNGSWSHQSSYPYLRCSVWFPDTCDFTMITGRLLPVEEGDHHNPIPIVLDTYLRFSPEAKLLKNYRAGTGRRPLIATKNHPGDLVFHARRQELQSAGAEILCVPQKDGEPPTPLPNTSARVALEADESVRTTIYLGKLSISALLDELRTRKIRSLMVEGGAEVISSFLNSGHTDHLIVTIAPTIVGHEGVGYEVGQVSRSPPPPPQKQLPCLNRACMNLEGPSDGIHTIADNRSRYCDGMEGVAVASPSLRHLGILSWLAAALTSKSKCGHPTVHIRSQPSLCSLFLSYTNIMSEFVKNMPTEIQLRGRSCYYPLQRRSLITFHNRFSLYTSLRNNRRNSIHGLFRQRLIEAKSLLIASRHAMQQAVNALFYHQLSTAASSWTTILYG